MSVSPIVPTIPSEFHSLLRYDEKYQTLICKPCALGIDLKGFHRHLQGKHNIGHKDRNAILHGIPSSSCIAEWDQFPIPLNGSQPIQDLRIYSGFGCNFCDALSQNRTVITTHIYNVHKGKSRSKGCRSVSLQTWFRGTRQTYWTVVDPNTSFLPPSSLKGLSLFEVTDEETAVSVGVETLTWEERVTRMEETRLDKQNKYQFNLEARHHADDITPWLLRVKWPQLFSGKNLELIGETRQIHTENAQVIRLCTVGLEKLIRLNSAIDRMMNWTRDTLSSTNLGLCCWLRSPKRNEPDSRPFKRLQKQSSETGYIRVWKSFLCFCFRTCLLPEDVRERLYGVRFTVQQIGLIREIMDLLKECESNDFEEDEDTDREELWEDDEDSDSEEHTAIWSHPVGNGRADAVDELLAEKVFELCVKFWTQLFLQDEGPHSPLLYFTAVLGIDAKKGRFREPGNYTPMLAALMWVGRLIMLEYALPKREYRSLNWPTREAYNDYGWRLEELRRAHMIEGHLFCFSLIAQVVCLR